MFALFDTLFGYAFLHCILVVVVYVYVAPVVCVAQLRILYAHGLRGLPHVYVTLILFRFTLNLPLFTLRGAVTFGLLRVAFTLR